MEVDPEGLEQLHAAAGVRLLNYWIPTSTELSKKRMQWKLYAPVCAPLTAGGRGAGRVARHLEGALRGPRNRGICLDYEMQMHPCAPPQFGVS